ncbi:zinc transporter ZIP9-like isoform X3 [Oncorhynchus keta]|uniref:zinc transporter ZIP9-like isoform X3 n=1 Tax=Oncorhynchus keta TaxID=8018 RepID=UPI00227ADB2F|nr:zinc transporter ZIP9-like isoform X3 [Oncorhynchus keta]
MDEAMAIMLISIVMFLGCFLLGLIPLLIKLSEKRLQFVSIFGAGLLCGTALAIILPEGVELLEESWRVSSCSVVPVAANKNASDGGVGGQLQEMGPSSKGLPARFFIGVSLVLGFILMFLVDQISSYCSIHADGVVLGVAVVSSKVTVQLVVFLAVILHKAPAAFGLATFLLRAGLEKRQIQKHLLVFSAAAPVLSIITYFILNASGGSAQHRLSATGVGMLFSAGTFLYVATVHVLPEVSSRGQQQSFVNVISGTGHLHGTGTGQQQSSPHLHGTGTGHLHGTGTGQQQSSPYRHGTGTGQQQSSPYLHGTGTGQQQSSPYLHGTGTGQQQSSPYLHGTGTGQQQSSPYLHGTGTGQQQSSPYLHGTGTGQQQSSPYLHGTGTGTGQQQSSPYLHGTGTGTGQQQSSPYLHGTGTGQQQSSPHLHGTGTGQQGDLGVLESLTLILGAGLPVLLALGLHDD